MSKYKYSVDQNGKFISKRKFSLLHFLLGRSREYCPDCDSIEYFYGQSDITGGSCCRCGYNETIRRIWNNAMKGA